MRPNLLKLYYRLPLVPLLLLFTATGVAAACPDADAVALKWLDKMSRSMRQTSYQGIVTLQRDDKLHVMQVSHVVDQGRSSERLSGLTGQGAQVIRGSHSLDCIHPGDRLLRLDTPQGSRCGIAEQYRFKVVNAERVAGRKAVGISIQPRDMYRYGYTLALDRETGVLLRTQTINGGQKTLETTQFAQISYTQDMHKVGDVNVVHQAQHPHNDSPPLGLAVARAWNPGWIPRGFAATDTYPGLGGRRTYTDGLAVFSVFLEDLDKEVRPGEGLVRQGSTTTYTRGMLIAGQPVLVTVIGEVPVNTARMVADSVSWVE